MPIDDDQTESPEAAQLNRELTAAIDAFVDQLGAAETSERALHVGDRMPPFVLPNVEGRLVFSDELLSRGNLVLTFFRGDWCPFCQRMLGELEQALPAIVSAGGHLVALSPDTGSHLAAAKSQLKLGYEVVSDIDGAVGLQFGVLFRTPSLYRTYLTKVGIDLPARHGNDSWFIPMPATYVVDRSGVIRYAFAEADFRKRAEPSDILAALRSLAPP